MTTPKTKPVPTAAMEQLAGDIFDSPAAIAQALADIDAEAYARGRADERERCWKLCEDSASRFEPLEPQVRILERLAARIRKGEQP